MLDWPCGTERSENQDGPKSFDAGMSARRTHRAFYVRLKPLAVCPAFVGRERRDQGPRDWYSILPETDQTRKSHSNTHISNARLHSTTMKAECLSG